MLGLAILVAGALFGAGAVCRLGGNLTRLEAIALAGAFALVAAPWLLFVAAWTFGFAAGIPFACAALGGVGHLLGRGRRLAIAPSVGTSRLSWAVLATLLALLFHGHMFHAESGGLFTGGTSYGDLGLHGTLASHFAVAEVSFDSPIVAGEPLTYPFLGDFLVACLMRGGWSMGDAFAMTGWLSAMVGFAMLQAVALRLFGRRGAATIAVWLVVLSGALIGLWYAAEDVASKGLPSSAGAMPSYANMWDRGVTWSNLVCDFLLPQRAFLAAFPVLWAALWLLRAACDDDRVRRPLLTAALLIGALPMLHVHSFLLGVGHLLALALWSTAARRRGARTWWLALVVAGAVAAPQLAWQLGESWGSGFGRWNLGWRAPSGGFWTYWLRNWGVPLALVPAAAWAAWRLARGGFALPFLLASVAVFAICNIYQFQPHDWDNMKLVVYAHMGVAVMLGGLLATALERGVVARACAVIAIVLMTGTGALTLVRELDHRQRLASPADVRVAAELRRRLPPDARVLTAARHNHPVAMLAGRSIVMGYRGWLWTHGYDAGPLARDVTAMFRGDEAAQALFARHGVTHVYVGAAERDDFQADLARFRVRFESVLARDGVEVFDVRGGPPRLAQRPGR